jgi:stage III sporulation protein AE
LKICVKAAALAALLALLTGFSALAQDGAGGDNLEQMYYEQLKASGAEQLWESLPPETLDLLDRIGIDSFDPGAYTGIRPENVADNLLLLLNKSSAGPIRAAAVLLGIVLLYALIESMRQAVKEETVSKVYGVICAFAACAALIIPVAGCIKNVARAAESSTVLMLSFVPVFAGIMLVSGQAVTAASYQSAMLFAVELISIAATELIVPLMTVSLALSATGSVTPDLKLGAAGGLINKSCGWLLGIAATVFTGLMAVQGLISAAADDLTTRTVKFSLGAFVPVVGSALGEALNTVRGCLSLLKSTLGGFGVIAIALIALPPIIECVIWLITLGFLNMAAEMFSLSSVSALFKAVQGVLKTLVAVLLSCSMFMIVATTVVTLAGGGGR